MKYAFLVNNVVNEIIPDENPAFPGIPITERYSPDILDACIALQDDAQVDEGMIYNPETQTFSAPPEPEPLPEPEPESEPGQPTLTERVAAIETAIEKGLSL